jgi:hypothetical protein
LIRRSGVERGGLDFAGQRSRLDGKRRKKAGKSKNYLLLLAFIF